MIKSLEGPHPLAPILRQLPGAASGPPQPTVSPHTPNQPPGQILHCGSPRRCGTSARGMLGAGGDVLGRRGWIFREVLLAASLSAPLKGISLSPSALASHGYN